MPSDASASRYPDVDPRADYPALERQIIERWFADDTFKASVESRPAGDDGSNEYVFYDGPPFANGLPHYGHLLTGFVKDAVPRYQTMRGRRVERRFGWDTHGLPVEMEAEKRLGVSGRFAIEDYGIDRFNEECRSIVGLTSDTWKSYVTRQARWVDMANDYKTLDLSYMESVMWAIKQLWDKGLLYEGQRVLPYCWECETPLSNFETRMDDSYHDRQDPAVTVAFTLEDGRKILVWTTTPWTLPSNLALAVGPDIDYAVFALEGTEYLIGEAAAAKYEQQLEGAEKLSVVKGRDLVGLSYTPLFPYFADSANAFRVLAGDFVSTEEGTGTVHIAPGFGEDDQQLGDANGITLVAPVDAHGAFTSEVPDFAGMQVFDANTEIIRALREQGTLVRHDSYVHSYPHCWRTDTPLIYRAVSSWFVKVTAIRDRMLELNQDINWVPEHVRDGSFGKWLEGARDWSISRNRFWGSPIPVWKSDDPAYPRIDVYGSLDEIEADFGVRPDDLHRPAIDELVRPNPDDPTGQSMMRRVTDVLDCWFESGSMPFAQVHYPFENREWFENHFPADFIVEYIGQTRGWFYTMHVLSTALFDKPAFENCLVHGVLLGEDGQKLSKRLKNYPDPVEVFNTIGSDAMRWAMLSSPVLRGGDLITDKRPMEEAVRQVLNPIWNSWHFFTLYANTEDHTATFRTDATGVLDRYIMAKTRSLIETVTEAFDRYDLFGATAAISSFLDALTNWYVRRSRDRFWAGDADALDTMATVLEALCRVAAPFLPLLSDSIYQGLTGQTSVHLTDWPDPDEFPADPELVRSMDQVRDICSAGSSIRKAHVLRVRLPLPALTVSGPAAIGLEPFIDLIADEVNVKTVRLEPTLSKLGEERFEVDLKEVGRRLGRDTPKVVAAMKAGDYSFDIETGVLVAAEHSFTGDEFVRRLVPNDDAITRPLPGGTGLVQLDTTVDAALEEEGLARDVIRLVQVARREAGLDVADRIRLTLDAPDDVAAAVEAHKDRVQAETLATELHQTDKLSDGRRGELPDGRAVHIGVAAIS